MKRLLILFLPFALAQATPPPLPPFPPLEFHPPKPTRTVLENGVVVFLLEDHELPLIHVDMKVQGGSQADPLDKIRLGGMYGESLTSGGSLSHTPEDIEKTLDRRAASIEFSVDLENGSASMSSRRDDFDLIFNIFTDLILHPQFRKDKIEIARAKVLDGFRRMNDEPDDVARREFRKLMYGAHHPYARISTPAMIKNIKRDDFLIAHGKFFRPNGCWIAITGDFESAKMLQTLKKSLESWPKSNVEWPLIPEPAPFLKTRLFYIQRPITQSQIRFGDFGIARHSPDHFAWEVFNELWGGSGTSVLFRKVRTEQGLAYSVGSGYSEPMKTGIIVAVSQTRGSQTMAAVQSMMHWTKEILKSSFPSKDISDAKEAIRNRFVSNFTSSAQIASYALHLEYFGYPADYLDTYNQKVAQVKEKDLERMASKYLHPDRWTILLMGDLSTFEKPLSTLGKPQEIKLQDYSLE